jgi:hypothetical protein
MPQIRLLLALAVFSMTLSSEQGMPLPRYDGKELLRPDGYREWMFVGANFGVGYGEGAGKPNFKNIFMQREAYRQFVEKGVFPDKTMLVMEVFEAGENDPFVRRGQFEGRFVGVEVALKDEGRFPEKWAYFDFANRGSGEKTKARAFPKDACWNCHNQHGAIDNVFVQFYPALRDIARK